VVRVETFGQPVVTGRPIPGAVGDREGLVTGPTRGRPAGEAGRAARPLTTQEIDMRKLNRKQKATVAIAFGAVGVAGSGVAYAYWTSDGTGTGTASTVAGNTTAFSVTGNVPAAMYPGDSPQTITATVKNNGAEKYKVESLVAYVTTNKGAACDGSNFLINGNEAPSTALTAVDLGIDPTDLAANGTKTKTYTIQFNNKATNQDGCKDATVSVNYVAS
jgi:hypothetical protein